MPTIPLQFARARNIDRTTRIAAFIAAATLLSACGGNPAAPKTSAPISTDAPTAPPVAAVRLITVENIAENYHEIAARFPANRQPGIPHGRGGRQMFALEIDAPDHPMLQEPLAGITSRRDNLGNNLSNVSLADRGEFFPLESNLSLDHRHAFVFLSFNDGPARGATSVDLDGKVEIRCAATHQPITIKNIPFRPGAAFQIGGQSFSIDSIETRYEKTEFTITTPTAPQNITNLRLLDAKSNAPFATFLTLEPPLSRLYELHGTTAQPPASVNIEAETSRGEETFTIPFHFNISIGGAFSSTAAAPLASLAPATSQPTTAPGAHVAITPIGLRIDVPIDQKLANDWFSGQGVFESIRRPTTKLWLHVAADRPILKATAALYSASTFTDDRGTILHGFDRDKPAKDFAPQVKGLSNDATQTSLAILSNDLPAPGTKFLNFKGTLTLEFASAPVKSETKNASMTVGTTFKIGSRDCIITDTMYSPKNGTMAMYVTIRGPIDSITDFTFLDSDGNVLDNVDIKRQFRPEFTKGGFLHVQFPRLVETATIRATSRESGETVTVPIDVKVPLGL